MAAIGGLDDDAAGDHCIQLRRLGPQPFAGRAVFRFGEGGRFHGETRGEHLRQDDQVRAARLFQQQFEVFEVRLAVVPGQRGLDQCQVEVG